MGTLRKAQCRPELKLGEIPAPTRLAPYAVAMGAEVFSHAPKTRQRPVHGPAALAFAAGNPATPEDDEDNELATGRFILLHDPDGSAVWEGEFRIVTYIRAQLEPDMGNDAMLGPVAWTWLVEAFGTLAGRPETIDIELRASWTPVTPDAGAHLEAWSDMVCTFAGLPPLPPGVTPLPSRRLN